MPPLREDFDEDWERQNRLKKDMQIIGNLAHTQKAAKEEEEVLKQPVCENPVKLIRIAELGPFKVVNH